VEAIDRDGTFLDIGCVNGLLMETVAAWAAERGFWIEPFGLDLSPRLVALARSRLPAWADRVFVGNAIDRTPPRRFASVRTELEYVPAARRRDLIAHLLDHVVKPVGRLIVCAYRPAVVHDAEPIGDEVRRWGMAPAGEAVAIDCRDGGVPTRVVWIDGRERKPRRPRRRAVTPALGLGQQQAHGRRGVTRLKLSTGAPVSRAATIATPRPPVSPDHRRSRSPTT